MEKHTGHWSKIRQLIKGITTTKHTLNKCFEFIYHFRNHIYYRHINLGMSKFEYLSVIANIILLTEQLSNIKLVLSNKSISYFAQHTSVTQLIEIYLSILFLIEKYGGHDARVCITYITLYMEIINLFHTVGSKILLQGDCKLPTKHSSTTTNDSLSHLPFSLAKPAKREPVRLSLAEQNGGVFSRGLQASPLYDNVNGTIQPNKSQNTKRTSTNFKAQKPVSRLKGDQPRLSSSLPSTLAWDCNTMSMVPEPNVGMGLEFNVNDTKPHDIVSWTSSSGSIGFTTEETSSTSDTSTSPDESVIKRFPWKRVMPPTPRRSSTVDAVDTGLENPCRAPAVDIDVSLNSHPRSSFVPFWLASPEKKGGLEFKVNGTDNLGWVTQIIRPIEVNAFLETEPLQFNDLHDIFQESGIVNYIKHGKFCGINKHISNTYKVLLAGLKCKAPVQFVEITNPNIISGIKNYEAIKNNLLHVIQHIAISPGHRIWFVINGYIANQDPVICYQCPEYTKRYNTICSNITSIPDISMAFKHNYLKLVTMTQTLTGSVIQIIKTLYAKWNLYGLIMDQSIQEMLTFFNSATIHMKQDILTVLLLNNKADSIFRAELLWNSLADSSEQDNANNIFNQLHYTIQYKLSSHFITPITNSKDSDVETELSYERRIASSLADKPTKGRMLDKLKEINNKSNDNTSKAIQYLDGILSIPFGKYRKESIIYLTDKFTAEVTQFIANLIIICLDTYIEYDCCNEYLMFICRVLELDFEFIKTLALLDELSQEQSIHQLIKYKSIKVSLLEQLTCELSKTLTQKMPVCPEQIDTCFLQSLLDGLEQLQLIQLYRNLKSTNSYQPLKNDIPFTLARDCNPMPTVPIKRSNINAESILTYIADDKYAKETILDTLANDGHFYDIGYPANKLDKYHAKLLHFRQQYTDLIQHKREYLANCYTVLDDSIYGQHDAKEQVIRIIGQWLNGNQGGYCLGFEGSPGVGKTSLAKYGISKALVDSNGEFRPFGFIALGGSSNGSTLEGHSYTYVGSTWGRIIDILINAECMNPIIFIDELDKISNTDNGRELIGILTHLTDKTQNNEFMDKYFSGVKIDLSQVLFIFSYNDYDKLDPILADRIHRIRFDNYTTLDKVTIAERYLIPKIITEINFMDLDISFSPGAITYLIDSYTYEAGVRKLKEQFYNILRDINIRSIRGTLTNISTSNYTFIITPDIIDNILLVNQHKIDIPRPFSQPRIGVVYGLYATSMGIGGITIIQVSKKYTDTGNALLCTGKQGDVMNESIKVALTLAINILPKTIRDKLVAGQSSDNSADLLKNYSFHIHCPDGSTPKDGPSAGCAFTVGLFSILTDIPVHNTVSMTGEVDIMGRVLPIGGLDSKIQGSAKSGITKILVPADNKRDIDRIMLKQPEILDNITICFVDNIQDVIRQSLLDVGFK